MSDKTVVAQHLMDYLLAEFKPEEILEALSSSLSGHNADGKHPELSVLADKISDLVPDPQRDFVDSIENLIDEYGDKSVSEIARLVSESLHVLSERVETDTKIAQLANLADDINISALRAAGRLGWQKDIGRTAEKYGINFVLASIADELALRLKDSNIGKAERAQMEKDQVYLSDMIARYPFDSLPPGERGYTGCVLPKAKKSKRA